MPIASSPSGRRTRSGRASPMSSRRRIFCAGRSARSPSKASPAYAETRANLTGSGNPEELIAQNVTEQFFPCLGVAAVSRAHFQRGGKRGPEIDRRDPESRILGSGVSDPIRAIIGQSIQLNGKPQTVVGVMPAGVRLVHEKRFARGQAGRFLVAFRARSGTAPAARPLSSRSIGRLSRA